MSSVSIVNLLTLLVFISIIVTIYIFFSKGAKRSKFSSSIKKNLLILGGYGIVLLVSMVVYFMIPEEKFMEVKSKVDNQNGFILYERLMNKEDIEEQYLASMEVFPIEEKELIIKSKGGYADFNILFTKTEELEEEIEVQIYNGLFEINELDFSDELPLPLIHYSNNIIEVENPPFFEMNLAYMTPEFPFSQFSGQDLQDQGSSSASRSPIIYIKVPKDLNVISNSENIMVEEIK